MEDKRSFLGTGWKFPPTFDKERGRAIMVSGEEDIRESLQILLSTRKGERLMLPEYGCDMHFAAFQPLDGATLGNIKNYIQHAILMHEPRVELLEIDIDAKGSKDGKLLISITYQILGTNSRSNMVFPFYLLEGTDLKL